MVFLQGTDSRSPLYLGRHILRCSLYCPHVRSRKEIHIVITFYIIKIIDTSSCIILTRKYHQMYAFLYTVSYSKSLCRGVQTTYLHFSDT